MEGFITVMACLVAMWLMQIGALRVLDYMVKRSRKIEHDENYKLGYKKGFMAGKAEGKDEAYRDAIEIVKREFKDYKKKEKENGTDNNCTVAAVETRN